MQPTIHLVIYFESFCQHCKKAFYSQIHDYGLISTLDEIDEKVGHLNFPVAPIKCPTCGKEWLPSHVIMIDKKSGELIARTELGTPEMPVINGEKYSFAVTRTAEEQEEYERGTDKMFDVFKANADSFWADYCAWALNNWHELIKELTSSEMSLAYNALGWPSLPPNMNSLAWRRDAEKRCTDDETKKMFWQHANEWLIREWFLPFGPDQWKPKELVQGYGKSRAQYLILHFPLPEELEKYRTEALAEIIKRSSTESGVLWERIGQLGQELEKSRKRAAQLAAALRATQADNAELADKLSEAKRQIEDLKHTLATQRPIQRDPSDVQRIARLKGLVKELREEVARLESLIPSPPPPKAEEEQALEPLPVTTEPPDMSVLVGKTIAIIGRLGHEADTPATVLWHEGSKADAALEQVLSQADVYVVLVRRVSHEVMWRVKEAAADTGLPVFYLRETGTRRILEIVAKNLKK